MRHTYTVYVAVLGALLLLGGGIYGVISKKKKLPNSTYILFVIVGLIMLAAIYIGELG